jgi:cell shape-determining protein MreC
MRTKKIELIKMIDNLQKENDHLVDDNDSLKDELNEVETYEDEYHDLQEIKDLLNLIKIAKERSYLGVATAKEDFESAFDKLLTYAD